jgi:hypothetical protein
LPFHAALQPVNLPSLSITYVLDEKDEHNLELVADLMTWHPSLPITTSLFNENIRPTFKWCINTEFFFI